MNFVVQLMDFVFKMMDFVFKMMDFDTNIKVAKSARRGQCSMEES